MPVEYAALSTIANGPGIPRRLLVKFKNRVLSLKT